MSGSHNRYSLYVMCLCVCVCAFKKNRNKCQTINEWIAYGNWNIGSEMIENLELIAHNN